LLLLTASLIRPEGVVLAGLSIIVVSFYRFKERNRNGWAFIWKAGLFYILPALVYFLWRWNYYGLFFPNTFYAKLNDGWIVLRTLKDLIKFFLTYLLIPALATLLLLWNNYGRNSGALKKQIKTTLPRPVVVTFAVALAFILITSLHYIKTDLMMNFSFRFFLPFFPVLLVLIGVLLYTGLKNRDLQITPKRTRLIRPVLLILIFIYLGVNYSQLTTEIDTAAAVFTSSNWDSLDNSRRAQNITGDERFKNYMLVKKYRSAAVENYYEFIYVRNDLAVPALER